MWDDVGRLRQYGLFCGFGWLLKPLLIVPQLAFCDVAECQQNRLTPANIRQYLFR
jgi:hypothetical protein